MRLQLARLALTPQNMKKSESCEIWRKVPWCHRLGPPDRRQRTFKSAAMNGQIYTDLRSVEIVCDFNNLNVSRTAITYRYAFQNFFEKHDLGNPECEFFLAVPTVIIRF